MGKIVFEPPNRSSPGFLKRMRRAIYLRGVLVDNPKPEHIDEMVEFLLPYIVEPEDRSEAAELLWDASQEDFENLIKLVAGGEESKKAS
jgi:hypothetical protein